MAEEDVELLRLRAEAAKAQMKLRAKQGGPRQLRDAEGNIDYSELLGAVGDSFVAAGKQSARRADDFVRSVASGATFGFADEIAAAANTATDLGDGGTYDENVAAERARDEEIPLSRRLAGEVTGGLATAAVAAPVAGLTKAGQAFSKLPGFAKAVTGGGLYGGLYGGGIAEGGVTERAKGAGGGAALGAATGGVAYPVVKGLGTGLQSIGRVVENRRQPASAAERKLIEAIIRDQSTPQKVRNRLQQLGPQATLADAGGENVLGLARAAAGVPGPAKNRAATVLNQRAEAEAARLGKKINTTLKPKDYFAAEDQFLANLRENAAGLYDDAYRAGTRLESKRLSSLLNRPVVKDAMKEAADLASIEGRLVSRIDPDLTARANMLISSGKMARGDVPKGGIGRGVTTEAIDDLKRGLDVLIERETNALTGRLNKKGAALAHLKKQILNEVDSLNPAYATARKQYGGDAEVLTALRDGRKFLKLDPEQITRKLADMSDAAKDAYRSGAARAMKDVIDSTPDTTSAANRLFGKSIMRDRLRAVFPDDETYHQMARTMLAERNFTRTRNTVLGGSPTAPRLAEQADLSGPVGAIADVATGGGGNAAAGSFLQGLINRASQPNPEVAKNLSSLLFNRNQSMNLRTLDSLVNRGGSEAAAQAQRNALLQMLIRSAGQQGGSGFARIQNQRP